MDQRGRLGPEQQHAEQLDAGRLRRIVLVVAGLNFAYFFVEFAVALVAGSVSLLADSVDFLEDTAINLLIFVALGWPLARRALIGKTMTLVIFGPAALAGWQAIQRFSDPLAPDVVPLVLASLGRSRSTQRAPGCWPGCATTAAPFPARRSCRHATTCWSTWRSSAWPW
jgi:Co/Zn/Cd efflux system component